MKKWADHLQLGGTNQRCRSALALLSIGEIVRCVEMLASNQMIERAVLLTEAAMDAGFLLQWEKNKRTFESVDNNVNSEVSSSKLDELCVHIFLYRGIPSAEVVSNICALSTCNREFRGGAQLLYVGIGHSRSGRFEERDRNITWRRLSQADSLSERCTKSESEEQCILLDRIKCCVKEPSSHSNIVLCPKIELLWKITSEKVLRVATAIFGEKLSAPVTT